MQGDCVEDRGKVEHPRIAATSSTRPRESPLGRTEHLVRTLSTFESVDSALLVKGILRQGSLQGAHGPSIALETGALFPSIPPDGTRAGWIASLIVSRRWAPVAIHVTATAAYERDRSFGAEASCIVEGPGAWHVRPVGEVFVSRDRAYALAGAIWQHDDKQAFDVALVVERDAGANGAEVRLGWTVAL